MKQRKENVPNDFLSIGQQHELVFSWFGNKDAQVLEIEGADSQGIIQLQGRIELLAPDDIAFQILELEFQMVCPLDGSAPGKDREIRHSRIGKRVNLMRWSDEDELPGEFVLENLPANRNRPANGSRRMTLHFLSCKNHETKASNYLTALHRTSNLVGSILPSQAASRGLGFQS